LLNRYPAELFKKFKFRITKVNQAFLQIYREGGIKGLWRGSIINVQRAALVNLGGLPSY